MADSSPGLTAPAAALAPDAEAALAPGPAEAQVLRPPLLASEDLKQGHKTVEIQHNGLLYRLQATRQGKLILTK